MSKQPDWCHPNRFTINLAPPKEPYVNYAPVRLEALRKQEELREEREQKAALADPWDMVDE